MNQKRHKRPPLLFLPFFCVLLFCLIGSIAPVYAQGSAEQPETLSEPAGESANDSPIDDNTAGEPAAFPPDENPGSETEPSPSVLTILYTGAHSFETEGQQLDATLSSLIDESVVTLMSQPGYSVITAPEREAATIEQARDSGKQSFLSLSYFRDDRRITLIARLYDTQGNRILAGNVRSGIADLSLLTDIDILLSTILSALKTEADRLVREFGQAAPELFSRGLVIRGPDEGAVITLEGAGDLGSISGGMLALDFRPLAVNRNVRLSVAKDGYYTAEHEFLVSSSTPDLLLPPLMPMGRFQFHLHWEPMLITSAGAGIRFFPVADTWYFEADYTLSSLDALSSINRPPGVVVPPPTFFHRAELQTGVYLFFPPDSAIRFRLGVAGGFVLFPGTAADPELSRNFILTAPVTAVEFNLKPIVIGLVFGSEFSFDIGGRMMLPAGLLRAFGPLRITVGLAP